jgi:hypothetical protein
MIRFEKDGEGMVILKPVLQYAVGHAAEIAVLLQIQYSDSPADVESGGKPIQFVLTPQTSIYLAQALLRQAQGLLQDTLPPGRLPN